MKRLSLFIIIFLCISSVCFAVTKTIYIQGGYDSVSSINIIPIPSQTEMYKIGMPFAIDDASVRYNATQRGRQIATWNILANYKMLIDIEAEILHNYQDNPQGSQGYENGLGYILEFTYNMSYYKPSDPVTGTGGGPTAFPEMSFKLDVKNGPNSKTVSFTDIDLLNGQEIANESLAGSADGGVFFMFDQYTTENILDVPKKFNALPNGNYLAKVIIHMKAAV